MDNLTLSTSVMPFRATASGAVTSIFITAPRPAIHTAFPGVRIHALPDFAGYDKALVASADVFFYAIDSRCISAFKNRNAVEAANIAVEAYRKITAQEPSHKMCSTIAAGMLMLTRERDNCHAEVGEVAAFVSNFAIEKGLPPMEVSEHLDRTMHKAAWEKSFKLCCCAAASEPHHYKGYYFGSGASSIVIQLVKITKGEEKTNWHIALDSCYRQSTNPYKRLYHDVWFIPYKDPPQTPDTRWFR